MLTYAQPQSFFAPAPWEGLRLPQGVEPGSRCPGLSSRQKGWMPGHGSQIWGPGL